MKKRKTIITVTVLILVLLVVILLSLRGCTSVQPDLTETESTSEFFSETIVTESFENESTDLEITEKSSETVEATENLTDETTEATTEAPSESPTENATESTSESTIDETTTAHRHDYTHKEVITATCTARGYTRYTCDCGEYYDAAYTDALGHNFSAWIVTKEATAIESGIKERHCTRCTETETKVIPATGKPDSPSEPVETEPQPTTPPVIEQPTTDPKPTGCSHAWQEIYHEEVSHKIPWVTCKCGARFATVEAWIAHSETSENAVREHTSWHKEYDVIVDTPAYFTWVCSKCGETRDTQP